MGKSRNPFLKRYSKSARAVRAENEKKVEYQGNSIEVVLRQWRHTGSQFVPLFLKNGNYGYTAATFIINFTFNNNFSFDYFFCLMSPLLKTN